MNERSEHKAKEGRNAARKMRLSAPKQSKPEKKRNGERRREMKSIQVICLGSERLDDKDNITTKGSTSKELGLKKRKILQAIDLFRISIFSFSFVAFLVKRRKHSTVARRAGRAEEQNREETGTEEHKNQRSAAFLPAVPQILVDVKRKTHRFS